MRLIQKHPRISQWHIRDYQAYKSLCKQTKVRLFLNKTGAARPHATWEYKHMLRKMIVPGEKIVEKNLRKAKTHTASIGESSSTIGFHKSWSGPPSPGIPPPSPAHTRSYGKAKKVTKVKE